MCTTGLKRTEMDYKIRRAGANDWEGAMELCWRTFLKFEAPVYDKEGTDNFLKFISGNELYQLFLTGDYAVWIAEDEKNEIIGTASLRSGNHISLLFVDESFHRQGVGTALVKTMQQFVFDRNGNGIITVNSSPYGEDFYHRLGFSNSDVLRHEDGIIFQPMTLVYRL